ncbi:MAG: aldehyde dehydrogenase [Phycisphaerales bacterium]|nr:aldehyde dehydrogenase [Phycisphaerales bacterium]
MINTLNIPILRQGRVYESLDAAELKHFRTGEVVVRVGQANAGLIKRDLAKAHTARSVLLQRSTADMIAICQRAGELFVTSDLPLTEGQQQSPDDYVQQLSATTGLPYALVRRNMGKLHEALTQMPTVMKGLTRNLSPEVLDQGWGQQHELPISYFAMTDMLGVVLPSNSPGVNSLWLPALALRMPVAIKPGREEPWTPWRLMQAFIAAGCPAEAFSFYPTDHEGAAAILLQAGRGLLFGDVSTTAQYANDPRIQLHGPGYSKVILGPDAAEHWQDYLEIIAASVADNGGRSCINASTILTPAHGRDLAEALAIILAKLVPLPVEHAEAKLAGFANARFAQSIDETLDQALSVQGTEDFSARHRDTPRRVVCDGATYLQPTIVFCDKADHPLANREFLFPFAAVVEQPMEQIASQLGPTLVATVLTEDPVWRDKFLGHRHIERLNLGAIPTSRVTWDQPHEGNLFEFLYRRRAIQVG